VIVAIPSMGRAGRVNSLCVIPSATVFVPEPEADQYRVAHPSATVVGVPERVRGITATRNWILDYAAEEGQRWVVQIDDDVRMARWYEFLPFRVRQRKLREEEWLAVWQRLFEVAEGLGYRIWGVDTQGATRGVYPFRPFIWQTYVTGSCMGIRVDTGIRFDESFAVKEDYELTLRCITEDGGVVGARFVQWVCSHWADEGGCRSYRTEELERDCTERLMTRYPGLIRRVKKGGSEWSIELNF